ncbi:hypothetical protein [Cupriavidus sp. UYPR2.512]|uniref:hypothetical protein n=1 Tax=Cupriavidus sp. UYPR2.512 TaxID=1080187 RepID=UPI000360A2E2|nr:hypothetical protein [Cupriavidus sp. UYPR2.512]UIF89197.1 metalloprotease [Cupriavidus necator]
MLKILLQALSKDGPVRGFALAHVLFRAWARRTYDQHTLGILRLAHGGMLAVGAFAVVWALWPATTLTGNSAALRILTGSLGAAAAFTGGTWFLMPALHRATLLGEVMAAALYGSLLAVLAWLSWDKASSPALSDPARFASIAFICGAVLMAFAHPLSLFIRHRVMRMYANHYAFETPYHQLIAARPARAIWRPVAIHEAGHALMYALGSLVPEDAIAYIDRDTLSPSAGAVSLPRVQGVELTMALYDWKLHTLLAGMAAEKLFTGTYGLGAGGDLQNWAELAGGYLLLREDVAYFPEPANDLELAANKRELVVLKRRQLRAVSRYLQVNRHIVARIADCLEEVDCLDHAQLANLLGDVVRTGNLPTPEWPTRFDGTPMTRRDQPCRGPEMHDRSRHEGKEHFFAIRR